jgi:protein-tyrosine-phosphatase
VPDPYYGGLADFELVLQMVERAADGFVKKITQGL